MKIAVISEGDIPSQWAHSINTVNHANGFFNLGHNVEILVIKKYRQFFLRNSNKKIQKFYGINQNIKIRLFLEDPRKLLKRFPRIYQFINKIFRRFPRFNELIKPEQRIANYCIKKKIDLTYCRSYLGPYYTIKKNIPTITEIHTNDIDKKDFLTLMTLSKNKNFRVLVTIHEILKQSYSTRGMSRNKILVLEDAVNLEKFDRLIDDKKKTRKILKLGTNDKIIMYCGSLKSGKGISIILETAKRLKNYKFILVGGTEKNINYWKMLMTKDNLHNVFFTGFVTPKIVPHYLKSADVLFMPYDLKEKNRVMDINTTSPLKLFEYMASKRPIVTTKIPTIEKIVSHEEHALLTAPNDIQDIIDNIQRLMNDEKLDKTISENAYRRVKEFTYEKRCKRILDFIQEFESYFAFT